MRLWTINPKYLDQAGLVAVWREGLLGQAVLAGRTSGYRHHPQLERFRNCPSPESAIARYLAGIWQESVRRGYSFDRTKFRVSRSRFRIPVTRGQVEHEFGLLTGRVKQRDPEWYGKLRAVGRAQSHPLFRTVRGVIEAWERSGLRKGG